MIFPSWILDLKNPVRPGSISTNRSSPGSSSDLLTPSRPEDTAQRLPADLPPFHYSSLMTRPALNYNGWDYDPCRLSSDGRLKVMMDPLFQRPRHGEVPIGKSKQEQRSSADFWIWFSVALCFSVAKFDRNDMEQRDMADADGSSRITSIGSSVSDQPRSPVFK